jgi:hypothetical protein
MGNGRFGHEAIVKVLGKKARANLQIELAKQLTTFEGTSTEV